MKTVAFTLFLVMCCSLCVAQDAPDGTAAGPSTSPSGSSVDPYAIVAAHVLKGQSNAEQRKNIRKQWLINAAQELEDLLRTKAFREIISFVEKNRDLFADIYGALKQVKGSITLLRRAKDVALLQGELLVLFGESAEILVSVETFSEDEIRMLYAAVEAIVIDTEANFSLLTDAFAGLLDVSMADVEKLTLLTNVHQRLAKNRGAVLQLQRYIRFIDSNRRSSATHGAGQLFETAQ